MGEFNIFKLLIEKMGMEKYADDYVVSVMGSLFVLLIILLISILAWRKLRHTEEMVVPSAKFSLSNIIGVAMEWMLGVMNGILGDKAERFLPLIGTLFIYIFLCNLLGFIPGFIAPTATITTNLSCALVVFIYYNYVGIRERGIIGYFKSFLGPVVWLAPLFLCVELISNLVRPVTLSVRLFGNIMGDHVVNNMFSGLVPLIVPIFFIALGLFVAFIQAFVFSILSTVYIALAIEH